MRRRITRRGAAWVAAATTALAVAVGAPTAAAAPTGEGIEEKGAYSFAWFGECGWSIDMATLGGVPPDGFSSQWLIKSDPGYTPDRRFPADPTVCTFDGEFRFDIKGAGRHVERFRGDGGPRSEGQRTIVRSVEEGRTTKPVDFTVTLCQRGVGCSQPLTGKG